MGMQSSRPWSFELIFMMFQLIQFKILKKYYYKSRFFRTWLVGGWATPLKNMKVNWDDDIPNIWENKKWQPNHQPDEFQFRIQWIHIGCCPLIFTHDSPGSLRRRSWSGLKLSRKPDSVLSWVIGLPPKKWMVYMGKSHWNGRYKGIPLWKKNHFRLRFAITNQTFWDTPIYEKTSKNSLCFQSATIANLVITCCNQLSESPNGPAPQGRDLTTPTWTFHPRTLGM